MSRKKSRERQELDRWAREKNLEDRERKEEKIRHQKNLVPVDQQIFGPGDCRVIRFNETLACRGLPQGRSCIVLNALEGYGGSVTQCVPCPTRVADIKNQSEENRKQDRPNKSWENSNNRDWFEDMLRNFR